MLAMRRSQWRTRRGGRRAKEHDTHRESMVDDGKRWPTNLCTLAWLRVARLGTAFKVLRIFLEK
eukprot:6647070-Pyramimonas_sp.AAC.1